MTRRRFIADELHGNTAALTGQNAAHLARVLRARVGQEYEIAANGIVRIGMITTVADDRVDFALGEEVEMKGAPSPPVLDEGAVAAITLLAAIFKFDRFEWAVEKATELGVAKIVPVIARRTDAHLAQAAAKRVDRWRRIAREASQQSRRVHIPEIVDPVKLKDAINVEAPLKILLAESEDDRTLRSILEHEQANTIALAVGPEGGWAENELQMLAEAGWVPASLGPTILRAETAVIAGLAVLQSLCFERAQL